MKNVSVIVCLCDLHVREGRSVLSEVSSVLRLLPLVDVDHHDPFVQLRRVIQE